MLQKIKNYLHRASRKREEERRLAQLPAGDLSVIDRIIDKRLTYLSRMRLGSIAHTCRMLEQSGVPGRFVEAGCALGGSSILIASVKKTDRPLYVYDVFGMIPSPSQDDTPDVHERYKTIVEGKAAGIGGDEYYGYRRNLQDVVLANFEAFGVKLRQQSVTLVKGLVQDTMVIEEPVAFGHIDVDWYDPVMTCLQRLFPRLSLGGSLILDDYHAWGGCRKATDEYLRQVTGQFILDDSAGSLKVTRVVSPISHKF